MGRPSNKTQRRAEIVLAMMQIIADKGYDGASIQAIAKQAGLTPGLIHYHFKSKQDILLESVAQMSDLLKKRYEFLCQQASEKDGKLSAEAKISAFINARLAKGDGASQQAVAGWVIIGAEAVRQPEVKAAYLTAMKQQQQLLQQLLTDYFGQALDKKQLQRKVAFVIAFMEGAFSLSITAGEIMPEDWAAQELMSIIYGSK